MSTNTAVRTALEVAAQYAAAYAAGDVAAYEALLAPDVHQREITPSPTLVEFEGPQGVVDEQQEFLARFDSFETTELRVQRFGERVNITTTWDLRRGEERFRCTWHQFVDVRDGRIAVIDAVCGGATPIRD